MRIGIIGGGITGLVAGYDLAGEGHEVTVIEAFNEVGGLAAGFPLNGNSLEKAYHHIFLTDTDIIGLTKELGIEDKLVWNPSSIGCFRDSEVHAFGTPKSLLTFKPLPFFSRIRLGFVVFYLQKTKNWRRFIKVPAAVWMRKWCGKKAYEVIWEPLLRGKFHAFADTVSMAWMWARIHTRAGSKKSALAKEELGYYDGGFAVFIEALKKAATGRGVQIRLKTPVKALQKAENGGIEVQTESGVETFDRVIATVPSHVLAMLIKDNPGVTTEQVESLKKIDYLGALCLVFTSPQSLNPYYWVNILHTDYPFLAFIQHTNLIDKSKYGNEHVYYVGTYVPHDHHYFKDEEATVIDTLFAGVQRVFPQFDCSKLTQTHLFRLRNAQHVVDCDYESKIPPYRSPVEGIYLANFSQIFPEDRGTNFAVREGRKIARMLLDDAAKH